MTKEILKPIKLLNKNFLLLWQGQFVSLIGNNAFNLAMLLWLKHQTESASLVGLIMMFTSIPTVIFSPVAGVIADRISRWKIIVFSDLIQGILILGFVLLLFIIPEAGIAVIIVLVIVSIVKNLFSAVFNPAVSASIPQLVPREKLGAANSMNSVSSLITSSVGQGAGGILFRILGAPFLFLVDGISFILSAISELFIKIPQEFPDKTENIKGVIPNTIKDIKEGLRFIIKNRGMTLLFLGISVVMFFIAPLFILLPFFVEDHLHAGPDWYGYMLAGFSIGNIIGATAAGVRMTGRTRCGLLLFSFIISSVIWSSLGFVTDEKLALVLLFLCGIFPGFMGVSGNTLIQLATPDKIRGRVFSVSGMTFGALMPLGMGFIGIITDILNQNIPAVYILYGVITVIIFVILAFSRSFREFLAIEAPKSE